MKYWRNWWHKCHQLDVPYRVPFPIWKQAMVNSERAMPHSKCEGYTPKDTRGAMPKNQMWEQAIDNSERVCPIVNVCFCGPWPCPYQPLANEFLVWDTCFWIVVPSKFYSLFYLACPEIVEVKVCHRVVTNSLTPFMWLYFFFQLNLLPLYWLFLQGDYFTSISVWLIPAGSRD